MRRSFILILSLVVGCHGFATITTQVSFSQIQSDSEVKTNIPNLPLAEDSRSTCTTLERLPPVLQSIADERREFQMNLGKAMDVIRSDYEKILKSKPDYSIYHPAIKVIDPSGVQLSGVENYKSAFNFLQGFVKFWFQERSGLQYRMVYDFARSSIRVSWHVVLVSWASVIWE